MALRGNEVEQLVKEVVGNGDRTPSDEHQLNSEWTGCTDDCPIGGRSDACYQIPFDKKVKRLFLAL
jgi:hypothetical protein